MAKEKAGRLWALKMLLVWRKRLGYWDWDAFTSAWRGGAQ
jgi:hypothetical protein